MRLNLRQAEELTRKAAVDFGAFYAGESAGFAERATSDLLVLTLDQKGVVMRLEDLRDQTRANAEVAEHKLESRLASGEKRDRKRMATVAAVYTVAPHIRTAEDVVAGLRHLRVVAEPNRAKPPRPEFKRVWASLEDDLGTVVAQAFDEASQRDPWRTKRWLVIVDGDPKLQKAIRQEARQ